MCNKYKFKILFEIDSIRAMYVHAVDTFAIRLLRNHVRVLFCLKFFYFVKVLHGHIGYAQFGCFLHVGWDFVNARRGILQRSGPLIR